MARLRITGGTARGRVLREAIGPGVRPTTDRVREALFSAVGQDLSGRSWLDAYGGTGIVALEAWSRGAKVTVIERDRRALAALRRRGRELGADWRVVPGDALKRAPGLGRFDLVFADPPYATDPLPVLMGLTSVVSDILILESGGDHEPPHEVQGLRLDRSRNYGSTTLTWYIRDAPKTND